MIGFLFSARIICVIIAILGIILGIYAIKFHGIIGILIALAIVIDALFLLIGIKLLVLIRSMQD
jgi:hypothetical protein